jgi:hypothetical protein
VLQKALQIIGFIMCLSLSAIAQRQDAAAWITLNLEKGISNKLSTHLTNQYRFNENFSRFDYAYYDLGLDRKFKKWLSGTAAYVLNVKNDPIVGIKLRHQVYINATLEKSFGKLRISNRLQLQTQMEDQDFAQGSGFPDLFYRNKTVFRYKLNKKILPFFSPEFYFRINNPVSYESYINRTRLMVGFDYNVSKRKAFQFYYMYQNQTSKYGPTITNVVGIRFEYTFKNKKSKDDVDNPTEPSSGSGAE